MVQKYKRQSAISYASRHRAGRKMSDIPFCSLGTSDNYLYITILKGQSGVIFQDLLAHNFSTCTIVAYRLAYGDPYNKVLSLIPENHLDFNLEIVHPFGIRSWETTQG